MKMYNFFIIIYELLSLVTENKIVFMVVYNVGYAVFYIGQITQLIVLKICAVCI